MTSAWYPTRPKTDHGAEMQRPCGPTRSSRRLGSTFSRRRKPPRAGKNFAGLRCIMAHGHSVTIPPSRRYAVFIEEKGEHRAANLDLWSRPAWRPSSPPAGLGVVAVACRPVAREVAYPAGTAFPTVWRGRPAGAKLGPGGRIARQRRPSDAAAGGRSPSGRRHALPEQGAHSEGPFAAPPQPHQVGCGCACRW